MSTCYLNGQFLPLGKASIPVLDRGFLFGDGIYEVIPVYASRLFRLEEHLQRLDFSLSEVRIPNPFDHAKWLALFEQLIAANGGGDQALYLQITRGVAPVREHRIPDQVTPTVFAMTREIPAAPQVAPDPIACISREDIRWRRCDIKTTSLIGNVLLTQEALDAGAKEVLLLRDGCLWEGGSSNVFVVLQGRVHAAPRGPQTLPGITRDLIVDLVRQQGMELVEHPVTEAEMRQAEEIWISSSTREMIPVTMLDGVPVGMGEVGPIYQDVWRWYCDYRDRYIRS